jgi:hypothetical protein
MLITYILILLNLIIYYLLFKTIKMFKKVIVVDGKAHLLGRLASYVAKQLLQGRCLLIQDKELL